MFHEVVEDGMLGAIDAGQGGGDSEADDAITAASLLAAFETLIGEAANEAGREAVIDEAGLTERAADAVTDGDVAELTLADGAAVLAAAGDRDPDAMVAELRDHLLIGMATAVLDVDTLAARIDADLTGQEVQQALEGRTAMTLGQLAEIMAVIERRKR